MTCFGKKIKEGLWAQDMEKHVKSLMSGGSNLEGWWPEQDNT